MKYSIFIFVFSSLLVSAQSYCGFEAWQLEYFTSSKTEESLDFLSSQGWDITNSNEYQNDGFFKFKKWFDNEEGRIFYYNKDDIKLILMRIPAECWSSLKKDLKVSKSQNIFFGNKSSTVKVKNLNSNKYGYVEFHTSDNNSVFNIVIYNQNILSIINNVRSYLEASNAASNDLSVSNYKEARADIKRALGYLVKLSQFSSYDDLQKSQIISAFYNKKYSFSFPSPSPKTSQLIPRTKKLIKQLDMYIDYKKSDGYDDNVSFLEFNEISKQKDILKIQNQVQTLLNSKTPMVWTLNPNPTKFNKCEGRGCSGITRVYPYVYEEMKEELKPKVVVSNSIRLILIKFDVDTTGNTICVYSNNPNNYDKPIIANVAKAIYNNSISFKVID